MTAAIFIGNGQQRWRAFEIAWGHIGQAIHFHHTCPDGRAPWTPRPNASIHKLCSCTGSDEQPDHTHHERCARRATAVSQ